MTDAQPFDRRQFVAGAAALAGTAALARLAGADEKDPPPLKIGLVGCGGRGTGAAENCLRAAKNVELVAMGDLFEGPLGASLKYLLSRKLPGVSEEGVKKFSGFDAYKRVLETDADLVLFCTPPAFRPAHVAAAVDAGKHVFMEKPVAVDAPGVRTILAAGKKAKEKKLGILSGTQYRHHEKFIDTIGRIHDGAIGRVVSGRAYYNVGGAWHRGAKAAWSPMETQLRNWYYYCWLSGDFIVEQHIHTIDVCNWVMGGPPVKALAVGGRLGRTDPKFGNIYDHFCVDYEYPDGAHVMSMCRHFEKTAFHVGANFDGTQGTAEPYQGRIEGDAKWRYKGKATLGTAYVQEHADLIASIRAGEPLNEAEFVAQSTLTAIMGREAAYTGKVITYDEYLKNDLKLGPETIAFGPAETRPVPVPGRNR